MGRLELRQSGTSTQGHSPHALPNKRAPYSTFGEKAGTWNALGHKCQTRVCEVPLGTAESPGRREEEGKKGGESGVRVPGSRGASIGSRDGATRPAPAPSPAAPTHPLPRNEPGPFTRVPNARFQESHLNTWYLRCKETGSLYLALR